MGTDFGQGFPADGEGPVRKIALDPFFIDSHPVTNDVFEEFVKATSYITEAERFGWSFVFRGHVPADQYVHLVEATVPGADWWCKISGADWRHPEGPDSSFAGRGHIPSRMFPGTTQRNTPHGQGSVFRPKPNGNLRRAARSSKSFTRGETTSRRGANTFAIYGRANFRFRIPPKMASRASLLWMLSHRMDSEFIPSRATPGNGAPTGSILRTTHWPPG